MLAIATLSFRRRTFNYARAFACVRENARRKLVDYLKFRDEKRYTFASDIKRPLLKHETFRRGALRERTINIHDPRSYRAMARRLEVRRHFQSGDFFYFYTVIHVMMRQSYMSDLYKASPPPSSSSRGNESRRITRVPSEKRLLDLS